MMSYPEVPESLEAPIGDELVFHVHASGFQIYICQEDDQGNRGWVFKAPEAILLDASRNEIGRHFGGPTWKLNDGSEVKAKLTVRREAPDAGAIPWLLLTVIDNSGKGLLSRVTSIQRIHTRGGLPPAIIDGPCTPGNEVRSTYTSDYYFYAAAR